MSKTKILFSGLFLAIFMVGNAYSGNIADVSALYLTSLQSPADQYQVAKATWLPDTSDDLGLSGHDNTKYEFNNDSCSSYTLSSCPANGNCAECPFNSKKLKLTSCDSGFELVNGKCLASSCSGINSSYKTEIPTGQICTKVTQGGLTCYKDCRNVSCSGYTLDCDTFNVPNSASKTTCPDCDSATAKCSPKLCKVGSCQTGYKIANDGTSCVALDDDCPNGYYKECETGTQGDPEFTEKGTACYQCKAKTPACLVEHCKECTSPTSKYCKVCEDGYALEDSGKTCRFISQCEIKGYLNDERAIHYYGDDYSCDEHPKLEDGTTCLGNCYTPLACCNGYKALSGKYLPEKDKFSNCTKPIISEGSCSVSGSLVNSSVNAHCTYMESVGTAQGCQSLTVDKLRLDYMGELCMWAYNHIELLNDLNCPNTDVDFTSGYWTGLFPPHLIRDYTNNQNNSTTIKQIDLKVKSYSTPTDGFSISHVDVTATDKIVLNGNGYLLHSTIKAPKVYINGNLGMGHSKIIADDIYVTKGVSIGSGGRVDALAYVYSSNTSAHYKCTSDLALSTEEFKKYAYKSVIGTPEKPAAFHLVDKTGHCDCSRSWDELDDVCQDFCGGDRNSYGVIQLNTHDLTIYGYNTETTPIFSEAVIWNDTYYTTGHKVNLTIGDLAGKSNSRLFYRFHTQDGGTTAGDSFLDGRMTYEGSINGKNQELCQQIKDNAYLYTDTYNSSPNCSLSSAQDRVECLATDFSKATCDMYGLLEKTDEYVNDYLIYGADDEDNFYSSCARDENVYASSGLECYSCKLRTCVFEVDPDLDVSWCHFENELIDKHFVSMPLCNEVSSAEKPETVCQKQQQRHLNATGHSVPMTPVASYEMGNGNQCVVCDAPTLF